jgi:hypothetical protein
LKRCRRFGCPGCRGGSLKTVAAVSEEYPLVLHLRRDERLRVCLALFPRSGRIFQPPIHSSTACHLLMVGSFRPGALQLVCLQPWPYYLPSFNQLVFQSLDFKTWTFVLVGVLVAALRPPFFTLSSDPLLQWLPCGNQGLAWRMSWIWAVAASLCVYSSPRSKTYFSLV